MRARLERLEEGLIAVLLAVMTLITFGQVIARYVFNYSFVWALELVTFLFAWLIFIGMSYGVRVGSHIGVDTLVASLGPRAGRAVSAVAAVCCRTAERIPQAIAEQILSMGMKPWQFLLVVNLMLLVAGNFMEPTGIILILAPILFPIALQLGIDPVQPGVIVTVNMEIGMVTPPVGLNLFVTSGITGMSVMQVVRAALPWLSVLLVFLVIVTYVPELSLWLPNLLF